MKTPSITIRRVPLDSLAPDPANARSHDERNLAAIEGSLRRFEQVEPLIVQAGTGRVVGGNGRLVAMRKLGWTECDVVEVEVDDLNATALGIALNRTAELADWDEGVLASLLDELRGQDSLDGVGFADAEIDELLASLDEEGLLGGEIADADPSDPPESPVSRTGDLWTLGEHRLLCGDSRDPAALERLLEGERADLVWTDPPYGVNYEGKTKDALRIENDGADGLGELLGVALGNAAERCRPGAVWYVAAPAGPQFYEFARVLTDLGIWRQTLVWVKDQFVLGHSDFHYRHEAVLYGWVPGAEHQRPSERTHDTVWEHDRPRRSTEHPTSKPVDLVTRAIGHSSRPGDLVLDPFVGSGTTLIAAEQLQRRFRGIELDPRYVDVAVQRWQQASGGEATLPDGTAFGERGAS